MLTIGTDSFDELVKNFSTVKVPPVSTEMAKNIEGMYLGKGVESWVNFIPDKDGGFIVANALTEVVKGCGATDQDLFATAAQNCTDNSIPLRSAADPNTQKVCWLYSDSSSNNIDYWTSCDSTLKVKERYAKLDACLKDYDTKLKSSSGVFIHDEIRNNIIPVETKIIKTITEDIITEITALKGKLKTIVDTISSISKNLFAAMNCKIIRREFLIVQNVVCYRVVLRFLRIIYPTAFLGIMLYCVSWCLCCTLHCTRAYPTRSSKVSPSPGEGEAFSSNKNGGAIDYSGQLPISDNYADHAKGEPVQYAKEGPVAPGMDSRVDYI